MSAMSIADIKEYIPLQKSLFPNNKRSIFIFAIKIAKFTTKSDYLLFLLYSAENLGGTMKIITLLLFSLFFATSLFAQKPALMLLEQYQDQALTGWVMSEKLDGIRAF